MFKKKYIKQSCSKIKSLIFLITFFIVNQAFSQVDKIGLTSFLEQNISQKNISISLFEKNISNNNYYHSLLLNKAVRFKTYIDTQEYLSNIYSEKCKNYSYQIGLHNLSLKNKFSQGISNSNFLFDLAKLKEPGIEEKYNKILNDNNKQISSFLDFSDIYCNAFTKEIEMRSNGIFNGNNIERNIISFNYLLDPVKEIFEGHIQEFSSLNNAPDENFFLTLNIPKSWSQKNKKDFNFKSTIGLFQPNEEFLEANIAVSINSEEVISYKEMKAQNFTDNDIVDMIYEDDDLLLSYLKLINSKNKISCTLYNNGKNKFILFSYFDNNLGKSFKNEILEGQKTKNIGSIAFKNGKLVIVNCTGLNNNYFSSYEYYSKVFFKIITSLRFKDIKQNTIYLTEEQNMKFIELKFKNLNYKFMVDTGATNVIINKKVLSELLLNDIVKKENYVGDSTAIIADGSLISCQNWLIPFLKIGKKTIKNLLVSVVDSEDSILLFGMDGLKKLNIKKMNLFENELILNLE